MASGAGSCGPCVALVQLKSSAGQRTLEPGGPRRGVARRAARRGRASESPAGRSSAITRAEWLNGRPSELLGAHVSTQGGVATAPGRGTAIGASAIQVFTKTPNQWREPVIESDVADAFRRELARSGIARIVAHDSYLINLASPDRALRARSEASFGAELERCARARHSVRRLPSRQLHRRPRVRPGSGTRRRTPAASRPCPGGRRPARDHGRDRHRAGQHLRGARRAARGDRRTVRRPRRLLRRHLPPLFRGLRPGAGLRRRVAADGTRSIGLAHLRCLHLNDSKTPFDSRRDRHELIGEGSLGAEPFRRIMRDPRFAGVMKILETPKGDDEFTQDRRMLRRLRAYARVRPAR